LPTSVNYCQCHSVDVLIMVNQTIGLGKIVLESELKESLLGVVPAEGVKESEGGQVVAMTLDRTTRPARGDVYP
jgi:hypothetical protein